MQSVTGNRPAVMPERLCNLPPFPAVANEVLSLASNPNVDLRKIAAAFRGDAAFAAEILAMANSPLFGLQSRVHSIVQAVAVLGLARLRSLAVSVAMRAVLGNAPSLRGTWRHSAATAIVCQELAGALGVAPDRAYTAGLMHDVGRLGLLKSYRVEIEPTLTCSYGSAAEALAVESTLVQVDHAQAGAWLVKTWGFPDQYHEICLCHHDPIDDRDFELLRLVKASCRIASTLGFAAVRYAELPSFQATITEAFAAERIAPEAELKVRVGAALNAFHC